MIDTAWDEYRAWAARARELQKTSQLWNTLALVAAGTAAVFGAAALQTATHPPIATTLSLAAAIAAGAVPFLARKSSQWAPRRNGSAPARPRKR